MFNGVSADAMITEGSPINVMGMVRDFTLLILCGSHVTCHVILFTGL